MSFKLGLIFISANLFLFSCAPKDEKLNRPDTGAARALAAPGSEDAIKMLFISFDREVEALHYLKATLNADYATQKKLTVEDVSATVKKLSYESVDSKGLPMQNIVQASIELNDDKTVKSVIIQKLFDKKISEKKISETSSVKELSSLISITPASTKVNNVDTITPGYYYVESTSIAEVNSKEGGNVSSNTFANFTFAWDGKPETLNNAISIKSVVIAGHNKYQVIKSTAKATQDTTLTVALDADCAKMNGEVVLQTTNKGSPYENFKITLNDSSISVAGKSVSYKAADCASRPVVDLGKLF
jgi:hypothetical protein